MIDTKVNSNHVTHNTHVGETLKIREFFERCLSEDGKYEILTPDGFKPVGDLYFKSNKQKVKITLSNNYNLIGSEDHLVEVNTENINETDDIFDRLELLDNSTFIRLKNIKEGDPVLTDNGIHFVSEFLNLGIGNTYDLEVLDEKHVYYSNNIKSHNTGKTAIVEGLALKIIEKKCPRILFDKRVVTLDLTALVANTKFRGMLEDRMKAIIQELEKADDVILFIDEIHTMVGTGNSSGALDVANILKPALARGDIQCIGATTLDEFREHIEKDGALTRRFQQVLVNPPSKEDTLHILENIKNKYEEHHRVSYTQESIEACVNLSDRYITDRSQPDKAIDIMDEVGARSQVRNEPPQVILDLEEEINQINIKKIDVVKQQKYEEAAKLRDIEKGVLEKLEKETKTWKDSLDQNRKVITEDDVAGIVSMMTGIPVTRVGKDDMEKLREMSSDLKKIVIGQDDAIDEIVKAIKRNRMGIKKPGKPQFSSILVGMTGVGKTFLVKKLTELLFGSEDSLIRLDMSEYMEKHSVSKLIGSPPGYIGYEEGGQLTEKVRRKPYSVVLLDEIEKAHPDVFNILLQVLDDGQLTDASGRKVDFKNTIIVMTSNVGVRKLQDFGTGVGFNTKTKTENVTEVSKKVIQDELKKTFAPEFLNRLDDIIVFKSLTKENISKIVDLPLKELIGRIGELGYTLEIEESMKEHLIEVGYDEKYGARPLNRSIQKWVEDPIAEKLLEEVVQKGDTMVVSYDKEKLDTVIQHKKQKKSKK